METQAKLPHTTVSPITLSNIDKPAACNKIERKIFTFLEDDINIGKRPQELYIDDFAAFLLDLLDYKDGVSARSILTRRLDL